MGFVQSIASEETTVTTHTTWTAVFGTNVTSGNTICAGVFYSAGTASLSSVADNLGNTYHLVDSAVNGNNRFASYYAYNITGGACTITLTFGSATSFPSIDAHEVTATTADPLDGHAISASVAGSATTDALTSGSFTTTANGDYIFGWANEYTGAPTAVNAGTGYTRQINNGATSGNTTEDMIQSTAGAVPATFTETSAVGSFYVLGMAIKQPAGGATRQPLLSLLGVG